MDMALRHQIAVPARHSGLKLDESTSQQNSSGNRQAHRFRQ
jgi:hypothetical protein